MIKTIKKLAKFSVLATAGVLCAANVNAGIIFSENFEANDSSSFSGAGTIDKTVVDFKNDAYDRTLGNEYLELGNYFLRNDTGTRVTNGAEATIFDLGDISNAVNLRITFDLLAIDSWDGSDQSVGGNGLEDFFNMAINFGSSIEEIIFQESIDHGHLQEGSITSHGGSIVEFSGDDVGYGEHFDTIYSVSFLYSGTFSADTKLGIFSSGEAFSGALDESWGIDNLVIEDIPTPSLLALIVMGIGGILFGRKLKR
jgi:hypothetical protein